MHLLTKMPYKVSWKADGTRYMMLIDGKDTFIFADRDHCIYNVENLTFLDRKDEGDYKTVSFYAKRARGSMASWIIRNRVSQSEQFQEFAENGYEFCSERSKNQSPVFIRTNS